MVVCLCAWCVCVCVSFVIVCVWLHGLRVWYVSCLCVLNLRVCLACDVLCVCSLFSEHAGVVCNLKFDVV